VRAPADILTIGFGTTVAMWAIGYLARLPVVLAPAPVVLVLLLVVLIGGGVVAGRWTGRGVLGGAAAGTVSGLLNLLVLGSFLSQRETPNALLPSAGLWVPGAIVASALLGAVGAWAGSRAAVRREVDWTHAFARVAVAATFLQLVAGGLVTSNRAGLAVVDWPNSYGYNMFLYPFARMTGGIYLEHAHRLLGTLLGLTTITLAILLAVHDRRRWVKQLGLAAVVLVIVQGVLGGLRVTGKPTLSADPAVTEPNIYLAVAHGVLAPIFFALIVTLAIVTVRAWRERREVTASAERTLATLALLLVVVQIAFGAIQRHLAQGLMLHVAMAFLVAANTISVGARTWGLHGKDPVLRRAGLSVVHATILQSALGIGAWVVKSAAESGALVEGWRVVVTTAHQGTGALLLATVVALRLYLAKPGAPRSA
jgi:cytochrome c oxidase assembly protein subunit 15